MEVSKKIEGRLQIKERRFETEQSNKEKRSEDYDALEEVFDKPTLMTVYGLLNKGTIKNIYGVVSSGKESRIYHGTGSQEEDLAVKIYLTGSAVFKRGMLPYIQGDPRFKSIKKDTRSLVYLWAQKEFKNLQRAHDSGVCVPKPIHVEKNVLIMEFIGEDGVAAPLLKEKPPKHPTKMYKTLLQYVKILYKKANLVHGDLSEYNIMNLHEKPVIFDVSQSVLTEHPNAESFLRRDLENLNHFFKGLGIKTRDIELLFKWVTKDE
ncbi:MAG: kinase 1 [Thermoproteota archaeon]|nr:kinase 1 [Thermoproteota archaeon]